MNRWIYGRYIVALIAAQLCCGPVVLGWADDFSPARQASTLSPSLGIAQAQVVQAIAHGRSMTPVFDLASFGFTSFAVIAARIAPGFIARRLAPATTTEALVELNVRLGRHALEWGLKKHPELAEQAPGLRQVYTMQAQDYIQAHSAQVSALHPFALGAIFYGIAANILQDDNLFSAYNQHAIEELNAWLPALTEMLPPEDSPEYVKELLKWQVAVNSLNVCFFDFSPLIQLCAENDIDVDAEVFSADGGMVTIPDLASLAAGLDALAQAKGLDVSDDAVFVKAAKVVKQHIDNAGELEVDHALEALQQHIAQASRHQKYFMLFADDAAMLPVLGLMVKYLVRRNVRVAVVGKSALNDARAEDLRNFFQKDLMLAAALTSGQVVVFDSGADKVGIDVAKLAAVPGFQEVWVRTELAMTWGTANFDTLWVEAACALPLFTGVQLNSSAVVHYLKARCPAETVEKSPRLAYVYQPAAGNSTGGDFRVMIPKGKLVRNKIPAICEKNQQMPQYHRAAEQELLLEALIKLDEEAHELLRAVEQSSDSDEEILKEIGDCLDVMDLLDTQVLALNEMPEIEISVMNRESLKVEITQLAPTLVGLVRFRSALRQYVENQSKAEQLAALRKKRNDTLGGFEDCLILDYVTIALQVSSDAISLGATLDQSKRENVLVVPFDNLDDLVYLGGMHANLSVVRQEHAQGPTEKQISAAAEKIYDGISGQILSGNIFQPEFWRSVQKEGLAFKAVFIFLPPHEGQAAADNLRKIIAAAGISEEIIIRTTGIDNRDTEVHAYPVIDKYAQPLVSQAI
ncbi:MAG: hypothetical protein NC924_10125 [Candidatus Omnitrophica bacterium]|nr:hypothetical protein [Candidatus Omnitrophota bacterium]